MSEDFVIKNEIFNNGKTVYLYSSKMYQGFVAYGFSAFIIYNIKSLAGDECNLMYSSEMQMPMVQISKEDLQITLGQYVIMKDTIDGKYIHLEGFSPLDEAKYSDWAEWVRNKN